MASASSKATVFLVEDDLFLSDMYRTKFELAGYAMPHAEDGEAAMRLIKEAKPSIILLDIVLPKKSGFDLLKELKGDADTKDIPVVLLTNLSQKDDVDKGFALGAVDYIIKAHFSPADVVSKVELVLKGGGSNQPSAK